MLRITSFPGLWGVAEAPMITTLLGWKNLSKEGDIVSPFGPDGFGKKLGHSLLAHHTIPNILL
jgi:hypothetical protein